MYSGKSLRNNNDLVGFVVVMEKIADSTFLEICFQLFFKNLIPIVMHEVEK